MTGSAFHKAMAQDVVHLMQVTGTTGWVAGLSKALQTAGYAFQPRHLQGIDIGRLQALLTDGRQRVWDDLDICPRTAPSQGARKCTYERWFRKPSWAGASLLTLPLTHAAILVLSCPIIHSCNDRANSSPRIFQLCTGCLQNCCCAGHYCCALLIMLSSDPQLHSRREEGCKQIYKAHLRLF